MMRAILDHPDRADADVSSLETVLHLGAPCPERVKRGWLDWLGPDRVDPAEIEQLLEAHPAVRSTLVVDRRAGGRTRLHAVVETADLSAVIAYATTLPEHRRPDSWQAVDVSLRTVTGKTRRRDWR